MKFYLYENHTGGFYLSREYLKDTYCETCGDSDNYVGVANTDNVDDTAYLLEDVTADISTSLDGADLEDFMEDFVQYGGEKSTFLKALELSISDMQERVNMVNKFVEDNKKER